MEIHRKGRVAGFNREKKEAAAVPPEAGPPVAERPRSFTLIEMLIVPVALSIVAFALFATFANGIKVWKRVHQQVPEEDVNIFFDRFGYDAKNSFKFTGINFTGSSERIEFATLVYSPRLRTRTVGKAIYFYDGSAGTLAKEERDYSQAYAGEQGSVVQSLGNIRNARFRYYFYDAEKKEYVWREEWGEEGLPLAVRVEFESGDGNQFTKTVDIQVST